MGILYILIDGVGLRDVLAPPWSSADLPTLTGLLGHVPTSATLIEADRLLWRPIDATMGVEGLPQSGTGHTALLTGEPASALVGRHQSAFPPVALRGMIEERSILRQVVDAGLRACVANAHASNYWELVAARRIKATASALAARGAGLTLPSRDDVLAGRALLWDITGSELRQRPELAAIQPISARQAGALLSGLAAEHDLVWYECFLPDFAGHGRLPVTAEAALERVDAMLAGILATLRASDSLVLVSDHGNIEEPDLRGHTRNPVPLLVVGSAAPYFAQVRAIEHVAPAILAALTGRSSEH